MTDWKNVPKPEATVWTNVPKSKPTTQWTNMPKENRFAQLLDELDKEAGVRVRDSSLANAKIYAQEQIAYGTANGKTAEELELAWLEKQLLSLKSQNEQSSK